MNMLLRLVELDCRKVFVCHQLAIPQCCPVSGNPQPGSHLAIMYFAQGHAIDVLYLPAYLKSYIGGLRGQELPSRTADAQRRSASFVAGRNTQENEIIVRNMEDMIQYIANDAAQLLGTSVRVSADLRIAPDDQRLQIRARAG